EPAARLFTAELARVVVSPNQSLPCLLGPKHPLARQDLQLFAGHGVTIALLDRGVDGVPVPATLCAPSVLPRTKTSINGVRLGQTVETPSVVDPSLDTELDLRTVGLGRVHELVKIGPSTLGLSQKQTLRDMS